jgi:hypothetical protein
MEDLEERLTKLEERISRLELTYTGTDKSSTARRTSLGEFTEELKTRGYNDLTIGIAYYKEMIDGKTPLTSVIIETGYREAREPKPKNFADTIYQNFKKHLLMDVVPLEDGTRAFVLTKKGIDYVEKQLSRTKEEQIKL